MWMILWFQFKVHAVNFVKKHWENPAYRRRLHLSFDSDGISIKCKRSFTLFPFVDGLMSEGASCCYWLSALTLFKFWILFGNNNCCTNLLKAKEIKKWKWRLLSVECDFKVKTLWSTHTFSSQRILLPYSRNLPVIPSRGWKKASKCSNSHERHNAAKLGEVQRNLFNEWEIYLLIYSLQ